MYTILFKLPGFPGLLLYTYNIQQYTRQSTKHNGFKDVQIYSNYHTSHFKELKI
jgi:hypothetical protein